MRSFLKSATFRSDLLPGGGGLPIRHHPGLGTSGGMRGDVGGLDRAGSVDGGAFPAREMGKRPRMRRRRPIASS